MVPQTYCRLALLTDQSFSLGQKITTYAWHTLHFCLTLQVNYANITVLKTVLIWWSLPFIIKWKSIFLSLLDRIQIKSIWCLCVPFNFSTLNIELALGTGQEFANIKVPWAKQTREWILEGLETLFFQLLELMCVERHENRQRMEVF